MVLSVSNGILSKVWMIKNNEFCLWKKMKRNLSSMKSNRIKSIDFISKVVFKGDSFNVGF